MGGELGTSALRAIPLEMLHGLITKWRIAKPQGAYVAFKYEEGGREIHASDFKPFVFLFLQSLLTHVSRPTKNTLNKLGVFTVSSFHAFICARSPSLLNNLLAGRGATKRRPPLLSRSNSGSSRRSMQVTSVHIVYDILIASTNRTLYGRKRK